MPSPDVKVKVGEGRADVLARWRAQDPVFEAMSDEELASFITDVAHGKVRDVAAGFQPGEAVIAPTVPAEMGGPQEGGAPSDLQRRAVKGLSENRYQDAMSNADQDIRNMKGRAYGALGAAAVAPLVALPLAGAGLTGAGLAAGLTSAGAGGLAGGLAEKGIKAAVGSDEIPQTKGALLAALGVDMGLSLAGDATMRGIGAGVTRLPSVVRGIAAKAQAGRDVLDEAFVDAGNDTFDAIARMAAMPDGAPPVVGKARKLLEGRSSERPPFIAPEQIGAGRGPVRFAGAGGQKITKTPGTRMTGPPPEAPPIEGEYMGVPDESFPRKGPATPVDTGQGNRNVYFVSLDRDVRAAYDQVKKIPLQGGPMGKTVGGMSPRALQVIRQIEKNIRLSDRGVDTMQALDGLIVAKGSIQQLAYLEESLTTPERTIFKNFANALDRNIRKSSSAEVLTHYDRMMAFGQAKSEAIAAQRAAEKVINQFWGKLPAMTLGAFAGVSSKNPAYGLGAAYATEFARTKTPEVAAWLLKRAMESEKPMAKRFVERAIRLHLDGKFSKAKESMLQAFTVIGYRKELKDFMVQQNLENQSGERHEGFANTAPAPPQGPAFAGPVQ